jgi:glutathione S-transferase
MSEITLYRSVASRSFTALWMLEELGIPYRVVERDLRRGETRDAAYLKLNPFGKVPTLTIGEEVVYENPAIAVLLADRYSYGALAPRIEDPRRGRWLQWIVFSTSVLEPARALKEVEIASPPGAWGGGWAAWDKVVQVLAETLEACEWLLGEEFTAADVVLGAAISVSLFTKVMPEEPALVAYNRRLGARPAYQTALKINWPPELFGRA